MSSEYSEYSENSDFPEDPPTASFSHAKIKTNVNHVYFRTLSFAYIYFFITFTPH